MPHSVVLSECTNTLWVADRERMAVRAIDSETGVEKKRFPMAEGGYPYSLTQDELTGRVYALVWARPRSGVGGKVWMADVLAGTTVELPGVSQSRAVSVCLLFFRRRMYVHQAEQDMPPGETKMLCTSAGESSKSSPGSFW